MFGDVPSSTSLLLQCGYRSKTCANTRATKLDGTLHRLCEFHRRKANENQQRLHQRHREERLKRRRAEAAQSPPVKRARLTVVGSIVIDPIPFSTSNAPLRLESGTTKLDPITFGVAERAPSGFTLEDLEILKLLFTDTQPLPVTTPERPSPDSPTAVDNSISMMV